jgi:hypothetical protein
MFKSSFATLVGATTGVYFSMDEIEDIENIAKVSPKKLKQERRAREIFSLSPMRKIVQDPAVDFSVLEPPIQIPDVNIPALPQVLESVGLGGLSEHIPDSWKLQKPGTVAAPPVVEEGIETLQGRGVDLLRQMEQDKLAGSPRAPMFNSGGIVQVTPRKVRQMVL